MPFPLSYSHSLLFELSCGSSLAGPQIFISDLALVQCRGENRSRFPLISICLTVLSSLLLASRRTAMPGMLAYRVTARRQRDKIRDARHLLSCHGISSAISCSRFFPSVPLCFLFRTYWSREDISLKDIDAQLRESPVDTVV